MIGVLIADDHAVVRQGLRTFLELQEDIEVVGEAADGEQALAAVAALEPDVVLMDLVMPRLDGVGFEPQAPGTRARRLGLTTMAERARAAGGTLEITSARGAGATVHLEVRGA